MAAQAPGGSGAQTQPVPADTGTVNLHWAWTLVDALAAAGVAHAVISPGSRSTPLTLACEQHPGIRSWIQIDERCAGFFALGLARAEGRPVAVVCTSGSALAHWHPAVVEANHSAVPLLLLSADRPARLQDCGANQTIDQAHFFGRQVRAFHALPPADLAPERLAHLAAVGRRAVEQSLWPLPGPVHLNLPFEEPLVPAPAHTRVQRRPQPPRPLAQPRLLPDPDQLRRIAGRIDGRPGWIVCGPGEYGPGFADALTALAARLDCPVLADPLSGLRHGPHDRSRLLTRYDAWLRREPAGRIVPQWVLRFGAMPVSKPLQEALRRQPAGLRVLVDAQGRWPDPLHQTDEMVRATPELFCTALAEAVGRPADARWRERLQGEEQRAERLMHEVLARQGLDEAAVVTALLQALPEGSLLFSSNSMPVRELDAFSGSGPKPLRILANRGASGIDGNVSTLQGLAAAGGHAGVVAGLLGDLAFYHDMNGLLAARALDTLMVVLNNNGGGIFHYLPQSALAEFERSWRTPTDLDLAQVARLYGLDYQCVSAPERFPAALEAALGRSGPRLIEVRLDPQRSVAQHRAYWGAVAAA